MDKELIAMCNCPEIQDKWEMETRNELGNIVIVEGELHIHFGWGDWSDSTKRKYLDRDVYIFIPRIENVLEWLGNKVIQVHQMDSIQTWKAYCSPTGFAQDIVRGGYEADTPLKSLLKAYMHLEHRKEWDGKQWK